MNNSGFHILLVEDDVSVRQAIAAALREEGYTLVVACDGQEAMEKFTNEIDLVVADLVMPRVDGRALLRWVTQNHPQTAVILMTAFATIPQAVEAIKAGATAYLTKPLDPVELLRHLNKAAQEKGLRQELARLQGQLREGWHYRHIIGHGPGQVV